MYIYNNSKEVQVSPICAFHSHNGESLGIRDCARKRVLDVYIARDWVKPEAKMEKLAVLWKSSVRTAHDEGTERRERERGCWNKDEGLLEFVYLSPSAATSTPSRVLCGAMPYRLIVGTIAHRATPFVLRRVLGKATLLVLALVNA